MNHHLTVLLNGRFVVWLAASPERAAEAINWQTLDHKNHNRPEHFNDTWKRVNSFSAIERLTRSFYPFWLAGCLSALVLASMRYKSFVNRRYWTGYQSLFQSLLQAMTLLRCWSGSPNVWTASSCCLTPTSWTSRTSSLRSSRPSRTTRTRSVWCSTRPTRSRRSSWCASTAPSCGRWGRSSTHLRWFVST